MIFKLEEKFNSFEEVQELLDKLKVCNYPMRVFNSQSINDYNKKCAKAKLPLEPNGNSYIMYLGVSTLASPGKKATLSDATSGI